MFTRILIALMVLLPLCVCAQEGLSVDLKEGEFIKEWLVCGPFPNPLKEGVVEYYHDETTLGFYIDYLSSVGGETGIRPVEGMSIDIGDGTPRVWKRYNSPTDYVDFCKVFEDNQGGKVAYAYCNLVADQDKEITFGVGSNDGIRVWLNGQLVWDNHCPRPAVVDEDCFNVSVKAGGNSLLIKVDQGYGNWGFYCRPVIREEIIKKLQEVPDVRSEISYIVENNSLRVWMARHSRYRVCNPPVQYTIQLINRNGDVVQKASAFVGHSVVFTTEGLENGPYRLLGTLSLPEGSSIEKQGFYYHGSPTVIVKFPDLGEKYRPIQLELLYDVRKDVVKDNEILKSEEYAPTLEPVAGGVQEIEKGKFAVLRTDLSPVWLRALLPAPGLGYRWYLLKDEGYKFNSDEVVEIDGLSEIEKNLRNRISKAWDLGKFPPSEWLFAIYNQKMMMAVRKVANGEIVVEERIRRIRSLSTLKSVLLDGELGTVWFSPSVEKVGKTETPPETKLDYLPLDLSRHEYEAFQVVVTPKISISTVQVSVTDGKTKEGYTLPSSQFRVFKVEYVPIKELSDYYGELTDYPDPIVPVKDLVSVNPGENLVLWVRVYVAKSQPPGVYEGKIQLELGGSKLEVPYKISVYNYTLPSETSTETAYGVSPDYSWHGPLTDEQKREVFELYMRTCMEYRISPYTPHAYAPITWKFEGDPPTAVVDFSAFDSAMERYLNQYKFNAFNVGGLPSELNGAPIYSPEYNRLFESIYNQVQEHLREKGWLHKAYWYWVDEPPQSEYPEVKKGMELLKKACPDIRRLLTCNQEPAPVPYFWGVVNLWVPIFNMYDEKRAKWRQELGETVWWYVCTAPRAPYANNFIDHPAINHRIRYWQIDKYDLDGDLFWSITYWRQNPWEEAMSIGDNSQRWGNGDGRMLYPPRKEKPTEVVIEPPVASIRLECIRDGLEDREYLLVLQRAKARRIPGLGLIARQVRTEALNKLSPSLRVYEQDPIMFYYYRLLIINTVARIVQGGS
ncbi:MAG: DUF4091 domain-containing protein [Candidatus Hydrogenedentes bacterium]|nr:DUF4091 domain-containing protein [Candidatus Hydrogenedentota bacterium]